jgi:hypothetical protein
MRYITRTISRMITVVEAGMPRGAGGGGFYLGTRTFAVHPHHSSAGHAKSLKEYLFT